MAASEHAVARSLPEEGSKGSRYSWDDRHRVVATYLAHGHIQRTAELCGMPKETVRDWLRSDWWEEVASQVRPAVVNETRGRLQAAINHGLDSVLDRLEHGDVVLDKQGQQVRVPVRVRDAAITTGIMIDRLQASMAAPTIAAVSSKVDTLADQLAKLSGQVNAKTVSEQ